MDSTFSLFLYIYLQVLLFSVRSLLEALGLLLKRVLLEAQISSHNQLLGIVYLVPHLLVHQVSLHLGLQVLQPLALQVLQPLVQQAHHPLVPQTPLKPLAPQAPLQPLAPQAPLQPLAPQTPPQPLAAQAPPQPLAPQAPPQPLAQRRLLVLVAQELHLPVPRCLELVELLELPPLQVLELQLPRLPLGHRLLLLLGLLHHHPLRFHPVQVLANQLLLLGAAHLEVLHQLFQPRLLPLVSLFKFIVLQFATRPVLILRVVFLE
jgi:hypothetical protein